VAEHPGEELLIDRDGTLTVLTLNRPEKLNALNASLVEALSAAIETASCDGTRLVVLKANGRAFSAGFDLSGLDSQSEAELAVRFIRIELLMQAFLGAPFVTLALVHGACVGAAADLVATCTHRVGASDAMFRMPGLRFGIVLGTRRFASIVGRSLATSILRESRSISAQAALEARFLTEIKEPADWQALVATAHRGASALPPASLRALVAQTVSRSDDADLAALVRSVVVPGLGERIRSYLEERSVTGR
jgi:enoyl-CoA hydratase